MAIKYQNVSASVLNHSAGYRPEVRYESVDNQLELADSVVKTILILLNKSS
jgi:hypothetical protein